MMRIAFAAGCVATVVTLTACGSSGSGNAGKSPAASPSTSMSMPASSGDAPVYGGGGASSGGGASVSASMLVIKNFAYSGHLTVKPGEKVAVVNQDSAPHTVTSKDGSFDSGTINGSGGAGSFTAPSKPGKYPFGCNFHPNMAGTLTVTG